MKKSVKKAVAKEKVERFHTGGGVYVPSLSNTDEKVLSLLGNRGTPLPNSFDSDAGYNLISMLTYITAADVNQIT